MPLDSPAIVRRKPEASTKIANGSAALPRVDGRSLGARRYREIASDLLDHLPERPSAPQEMLIRRATQIAVWFEDREAAFARGEAFDMAVYVTATNSLRRLLTDLGLERREPDPFAFLSRR